MFSKSIQHGTMQILILNNWGSPSNQVPRFKITPAVAVSWVWRKGNERKHVDRCLSTHTDWKKWPPSTPHDPNAMLWRTTVPSRLNPKRTLFNELGNTESPSWGNMMLVSLLKVPRDTLMMKLPYSVWARVSRTCLTKEPLYYLTLITIIKNTISWCTLREIPVRWSQSWKHMYVYFRLTLIKVF